MELQATDGCEHRLTAAVIAPRALERYPAALVETPAPSRPAAPAVVAVVVTRNPGPWLEAAVEALAAQDYPNLAALYVDAASDTDPTPRIAAALPDAYVRRLDDQRRATGPPPTRSAEVVDGAAFYCFLPRRRRPRARAPSAPWSRRPFRSNAGIVGPKLVHWDDPAPAPGRRVGRQAGRARRPWSSRASSTRSSTTRCATSSSSPAAARWSGADLFDAIGGFDEGIDLLSDDLDLCWRAHVAGARVVVGPRRRVAPPRGAGRASPVDDRRRARLMRHRLRTMLELLLRGGTACACCPRPSLTACSRSSTRCSSAAAARPRDLVRRLALEPGGGGRDPAAGAARSGRSAPCPTPRSARLQVRGSARPHRLRPRGQIDRRREPRPGACRSPGTDLARCVTPRRLRWPVAAWVVTLVIVGFGSRHLLLRPIAAVGGFLPFDLGPGELFDRYLSGWRDRRPRRRRRRHPPAFGPARAARHGRSSAPWARCAGCSSSVAGRRARRRLPAAAPHRLGPRPGGVALVVYGAIPLAYDAIADARWGALTVYAAAPWLLPSWHGPRAGPRSVAVGGERRPVGAAAPHRAPRGRASACWSPWSPPSSRRSSRSRRWSWSRSSWARLLAGAVARRRAGCCWPAPAAWPSPWCSTCRGPSSSCCPAPRGSRSSAAAASPRPRAFTDLLRFDVGPVGGAAVALGLPARRRPAAAHRPRLALRLGGAGLDGVASPWSASPGPAATTGCRWRCPPAETMLAPAAAGLAMAAGLGVVAFEVDLRAYGFGWRQVAAIGRRRRRS